MIQVFTSAAPNYIGKVRVLMESLRRWLPEARLIWAVADRERQRLVDGLADEAFDELLFATALGPGRDKAWLFRHDVVELSTAIKPAAALELLERPDCDLLLYFDPDIVVFSALDDLLERLQEASAVITPHQVLPETRPEHLFHELDSLRYGVFNLGFLGLRRCAESRRLLSWWMDRCELNCSGDWSAGVFTDQKWFNFVPVFFPGTAVLDQARFNVAPWNMTRRRLTGSFDEGFRVDGEPLGFYHFTGFDSGAHKEHLEGVGELTPSARMLIDWYRWRSNDLARDAVSDWTLGSFSNGEAITREHRSTYAGRPDLHQAFPDPFDASPTGETYHRWFAHHHGSVGLEAG